MTQKSPSLGKDNCVSIQGHIFPVVLDENGIPHHYATECANCGFNIAELKNSWGPCPHPPSDRLASHKPFADIN